MPTLIGLALTIVLYPVAGHVVHGDLRGDPGAMGAPINYMVGYALATIPLLCGIGTSVLRLIRDSATFPTPMTCGAPTLIGLATTLMLSGFGRMLAHDLESAPNARRAFMLDITSLAEPYPLRWGLMISIVLLIVRANKSDDSTAADAD